MLVAMIVHKAVRQDARVMKEANTIAEAGHEVVVFDIADNEDEKPYSFGPHDIRVVPSFRSRTGSDKSLLTGLPLRLVRQNEGFAAKINARIARPSQSRREQVETSFLYTATILANAVLKSVEPDVVHIHDHVSLSGAAIYKHFLGVPIVWDAHEIYEDMANANADQGRSQASASIVARNQKYVDRFVTINQSIADFYAAKYATLGKAVILPNAALETDLAVYDGRLHDAAGLTRDQKILLFQGLISPHRGITQLMEAASQLPDNWSLVFMGWGPMKEEMEELATGFPLHDSGNPMVSFIAGAPYEELASWTAGASLGAIPYENISLNHLYCTPNKLWEYPQAGVPILASDLQELGSTVRTHNIGVLIPRDFVADDIARAVHSLTDDDLRRMRASCLSYSKSQHWQANEHRLVGLYDGLAKEIDGDAERQSLAKYEGGVLADFFGSIDSGSTQEQPILEAEMKTGSPIEQATETKAPAEGGGDAMESNDRVKALSRSYAPAAVISAGLRRLKRVVAGLTGDVHKTTQLRNQIIELKEKHQRTVETLNGRIARLKEVVEQHRGASRSYEPAKGEMVQGSASVTEKERARYASNVSILTSQIRLLKDRLEEARNRVNAARLDQRDISPLEHNTPEGINAFFAESSHETNHIEYALALRTALEDSGADFDGKDVLDIGVGPGGVLQELLRETKPKSITGMDFSQFALKRARKRLPDADLQLRNVEEGVLSDADVVLCTEVLQHLLDPVSALQDIIGAVRPGGIAVLTVPDGRTDISLEHINFWSPESWKRFIESSYKAERSHFSEFQVSKSAPYMTNLAILQR